MLNQLLRSIILKWLLKQTGKVPFTDWGKQEGKLRISPCQRHRVDNFIMDELKMWDSVQVLVLPLGTTKLVLNNSPNICASVPSPVQEVTPVSARRRRDWYTWPSSGAAFPGKGLSPTLCRGTQVSPEGSPARTPKSLSTIQ